MPGSTSSAATARHAPPVRATSRGAGRRRWRRARRPGHCSSSPSPLAGEGRGGGFDSGRSRLGHPHPNPSPQGGGERRELRTRRISTGVMLAFAFPDRVARNRGNGSFVLANGRGAAVEQTSALARAPYIAVAELTGTAAPGRILLAAPIAHAEIERTSPTRSRAPTRFRSTAMRWRCGHGASEPCTRSRCRKPHWRCRPRRKPRACWPMA